MKKITCQFCRQELDSCPITETVRANVERYWCDKCQAEYLMFQGDTSPNSTSLYTRQGERNYRWTTTTTGRAILYYVEYMFDHRRLSHDCQVLYSLAPGENQPDITPQNITEKIETMLIFL